MTEAPDGPSAYDQAVKLLARRAHFRRELEVKLRRRSHEDDAVEDALDRLEEQGYLDDAEASRAWLRPRLERGGWGRARLLAELTSRGVDHGVASAILDELLPDDDLEAARREAERYRSRRSSADATAVARRLERRGFSGASIRRVVEELRDDSNDSNDTNDAPWSD